MFIPNNQLLWLNYIPELEIPGGWFYRFSTIPSGCSIIHSCLANSGKSSFFLKPAAPMLSIILTSNPHIICEQRCRSLIWWALNGLYVAVSQITTSMFMFHQQGMTADDPHVLATACTNYHWLCLLFSPTSPVISLFKVKTSQTAKLRVYVTSLATSCWCHFLFQDAQRDSLCRDEERSWVGTALAAFGSCTDQQ